MHELLKRRRICSNLGGGGTVFRIFLLKSNEQMLITCTENIAKSLHYRFDINATNISSYLEKHSEKLAWRSQWRITFVSVRGKSFSFVCVILAYCLINFNVTNKTGQLRLKFVDHFDWERFRAVSPPTCMPSLLLWYFYADRHTWKLPTSVRHNKDKEQTRNRSSRKSYSLTMQCLDAIQHLDFIRYGNKRWFPCHFDIEYLRMIARFAWYQDLTPEDRRSLKESFAPRIQRKNQWEEHEGCPGVSIYIASCKWKCFRSGRAASADFGCHKLPLLQVLFANNEMVRHIQFARTRRVGLAPLFVKE